MQISNALWLWRNAWKCRQWWNETGNRTLMSTIAFWPPCDNHNKTVQNARNLKNYQFWKFCTEHQIHLCLTRDFNSSPPAPHCTQLKLASMVTWRVIEISQKVRLMLLCSPDIAEILLEFKCFFRGYPSRRQVLTKCKQTASKLHAYTYCKTMC